ncbi:MAG: hypothetical protein R6W81_06230 [Bacteroidales bacterium]
MMKDPAPLASNTGIKYILHGNHCDNDKPLQLLAGSLSMIYENGAIRYVKAGGNELIRMIYSAVRDKDWLTINPVISDESVEAGTDAFLIKYRAHYNSGGIDFIADIRIEGRSDSVIICSFEGEALATFEKNRIGFCVLHPIKGCAGNNCLIEHTDGSTEQSFFPDEISPHQVFRDIKSMKWTGHKVKCSIDFEGDIFETEDQRNWTDASFKTYSTPLSIPYPVSVEKGTRIKQKIVFRAVGTTSNEESQENKIVISLFPEETRNLPSIGTCRSSRPRNLSDNEIKILRALRFDHYRADLHLFADGWIEAAEQACIESFEIGADLELALFFDDNSAEETAEFLEWYSNRKPVVTAIFLFHRSHPSTPDELAIQIVPLLRELDPEIDIVTGTNANFAQLNRHRPGETGNDHICYSIHPQEHASDNRTLVENLEAQGYSVRSALTFAGRKGIWVSPVTIQRRFNANNIFTETPPIGEGPPPQVDSRLMSLFGACWSVGSLKYLCESGADNVTYFETAGERGFIQGDDDPKWPSGFPAFRGMIFPVYHIFRFLLGNKNMDVVKTICSDPHRAECLALTDGKQARAILVSFSPSQQDIEIECCSGLFRIRSLVRESFSEAAKSHQWTGIATEEVVKSQGIFTIEPYSINFIEGWIRH